MTRIRPLRMLYIANGNGLSDGLGGSMVRTIEIAGRLATKGCKISFLTTTGGHKASVRKGLKASFYVVRCSIFKKSETTVIDRPFSYLISALSSVIRLVMVQEPDVIVTDSDYFCDVIPAAFARFAKKCVWVAMSHHIVGSPNQRKDILGLIAYALQLLSLNLIATFADRALVYDTPDGRRVEDILLSRGMAMSRIGRVNNGIDFDYIDKVPPHNRPSGCSNIGAVRLSKGLLDIVPIWRRVVNAMPDQQLTIVGNISPENEKLLSSMIESSSLEGKIRLAGSKDHASAIRLIKESKVFLSPSRQEGWGTAVCEALACGVPVVSWDIPTIKHLFGGAVQLVPVGDHETFASRVIGALKSQDTDHSLLQLTANKYSWSASAEKDLAEIGLALTNRRRS